VKKKTKTQTVYKVVVKQDDKFWSYCQFLGIDKYALQYDLGKTTVPTMGKIFVFQKLKDAKSFVAIEDILEEAYILKGIAVNPETSEWCCGPEAALEIFWNCKKEDKVGSSLFMSIRFHSPQGSLFCDSFTPKTILKNNQ